MPLLVLLVAVVIVILELTNVTHFFHKAPVPPHTASEYTKGEPLTNATNNQTSTGSNSTSSSSKSAASPHDTTLVQPTGDFVSSHHASLSSSSGGQESSTCNTTPGASCVIKFSQGSVTKSLPAKTADSGGAAYWTWTPSDVGLTTGSWKVTAVAILGSQQSTATDALTLEVSQ